MANDGHGKDEVTATLSKELVTIQFKQPYNSGRTVEFDFGGSNWQIIGNMIAFLDLKKKRTLLWNLNVIHHIELPGLPGEITQGKGRILTPG